MAIHREDWFEEWALNALVVLFYLPVALGSLVYIVYTGGEYALAVHVLGEHIPRDISAGIAAGTLVVLVTQIVAPRLVIGQRMMMAFRRAIGTPTQLSCMTIAIFAALGEELLFRGVLQERLGLVIATALFAVAHFPMERDLWLWPLVALPVGLTFGGLYEITDATLAPIIAHAIINALNLRWIASLPGQ